MRVLLLSSGIASGEGLVKAAGGRSQTKISLTGIWPPTELATIGALLMKNNFEVSLIDANILEWGHERIVEEVERLCPEVIITFSSTPTFSDDVKLARLLKLRLEEVKIAFYGIHVTTFPDEVKEHDFEFAIRREPEITVLELCRTLREQGDLSKVQGISYVEDGRVRHNPDRPFIDDPDSLPFPARELLLNEKYVIPATGEPYAIISASRGCPYRCIFCTAITYYGQRWRCRSPENIFSEMRDTVEKFGIKNFHLESDTFNLRRGFVLELCDLIIRSGMDVKWVCNSRVDTLDREMLAKMKQAGCWVIALGVESSSQRILDCAKKQQTVEQARVAVKLAKEAGIKTYCYFIFGLPGETIETANRTIEFAKELNPDYARFNIATPLPGSEFFQLAKRNGWINWDRFHGGKRMYEGFSDVLKYPHLSSDELLKIMRKAYIQFYFRPRFFLREISKTKNPKQLLGMVSAGLSLFKNWVL